MKRINKKDVLLHRLPKLLRDEVRGVVRARCRKEVVCIARKLRDGRRAR